MKVIYFVDRTLIEMLLIYKFYECESIVAISRRKIQPVSPDRRTSLVATGVIEYLPTTTVEVQAKHLPL